MADTGSTGFFGGLAGGFSDAQTNQVAAQKEQAAEQQKRVEQGQKQFDATIQEINRQASVLAAAGVPQNKILQQVQPLIASAVDIAGVGGVDKTRAAAMAQSAAITSPPRPDGKFSPVMSKNADGSTSLTHRFNEATGEASPVTPGAAAPSAPVPSTAPTPGVPQPQLPPSDTLSPGQISRANPPAAPVAAPISAPAPNGPSIPATQASLVADRFPPDTGATSAPEPPGPTMPADMKPGPDAVDYAISNNIHGPEFLKALPSTARNTVDGILDYKVDPDKLSKRVDKSGQSEYTRFLGLARQASNGEYDPKYYKSIQSSIKEFTSGGSQSPATRIETANKAIAHGGEVAQAIDEMQKVPGLLARIAKSNTPMFSYAANQLKNKSVQGTSEGAALRAFLNASNHFSDEVTKFYAGGQPPEAGRERVLSNYDAALSPVELYSALMSETRLMHGASSALQDRFKNAQAGPRYNNAVIRDAIPDFPVISQNAEKGLDQITQGYIRAKEIGKGGATASPEVDRIKQKYGLQ